MSFTISGNVVAVGARIFLTNVLVQQGVQPVFTYSDASGNYSFSGVQPGNYQLRADLIECVTAPYNTGYSYRNPQGVTVVSSSLSNVNFTPLAISAVNPLSENQF